MLHLQGKWSFRLQGKNAQAGIAIAFNDTCPVALKCEKLHCSDSERMHRQDAMPFIDTCPVAAILRNCT
jgi:hypothetical protein